MPSFIPRHYDIHAWTLAEARRYLDAKHQLGWRVAMMAPKPEPAKSSSFSRRFPLKKALRFQLTHELGDNREEGSSLNPKPQPRLGLFSFSQLERAKLHLKSTCNCMRNSPSLRLKFCPKNFPGSRGSNMKPSRNLLTFTCPSRKPTPMMNAAAGLLVSAEC